MNGNVPLKASTLHIESHYKMNHPKRGIALIFNHEFYSKRLANRRIGTNIDCETLSKSLEKLGFGVKDYQDLTLKDLQKELKKVSEMDHTDHDCLVVAVMSHGNANELYACDTKYSIDTIWSNFTDEKCETLSGKPKIFIIQACRGDQLDKGIRLMERTQTDNNSSSFCKPSHRDFLFAYATVPGYYAWRNQVEGSWFVQGLCSELNENGRQLDLLTLLTYVNRCVAITYESHNPEKEELNEKKQVPCITSMLRRLVQF